jgi:hypothetical protein
MNQREIEYKAFLVYDRNKNSFPLQVLLGFSAGSLWNKEKDQIHGQVKSYPQK